MKIGSRRVPCLTDGMNQAIIVRATRGGAAWGSCVSQRGFALSLSLIAPSTAGSVTSFGTYKCRAQVEFRGEPFNQFYVWTMSARGACVTVTRRFSLEVTGVPRSLPDRGRWIVTSPPRGIW